MYGIKEVLLMDGKKTIGQRLDIALELNQMKQKELAKELNVPDNTISYFVSGKRTPNTEQIIKISRILNVSSDWLLGLSDTKNVEDSDIPKKTGLSGEAVEELMRLAEDKGISAEISLKMLDRFIVHKNYLFFFELTTKQLDDFFRMLKAVKTVAELILFDTTDYGGVVIDTIKFTPDNIKSHHSNKKLTMPKQ